MNARDWAVLALAILVGIVLRSVAIGHQALWADEALTYVIAQVTPRALAEAPIDPTGPFYYWLHQWFVADGAGAAAGRAISLVAGVLAIPATYWLGRETVGSRGAGLAAWWVAVAAPLVDYSQEARAYAVLVLIVTLSAAMLLGALGGARRRRWLLAGFAVTALLALYTHFVALFWVGPALAILLFAGWRQERRGARGEAVAGVAAVVIGAVPEARRVWRYATENNAFHWLEQVDPGGFVALVARAWLPFGGLVASAFVALLLVGLAWRGRHAFAARARHDPPAAMVVGALLLQPLGLWLFGFFLLPVLMFRTMLPSLPAVGILVATLLVPLSVPWRMVAGSALVLAATATTVGGGLVRPKEEWNAARRVLAQAGSPGTLVVMCPFWKAPALMAATRGLAVAPLATPLNGAMLLVEDRLGAERRWESAAYRRIYASLLAPALGERPPRQASAPLRAESLFVVTSECGAVEEAAIRDWAGSHAVVRRWTSAARLDHAGIVVERWQLKAPRTLSVSVNR